MVTFDRAEQHKEFVVWKERYPDGYVINYRPSGQPMLHKADCGHLDWKSNDKVRMTKRKKVGSLDWQELLDLCLKEHGEKPVPCKSCLKGALPI